eukprot:320489_1
MSSTHISIIFYFIQIWSSLFKITHSTHDSIIQQIQLSQSSEEIHQLLSEKKHPNNINDYITASKQYQRLIQIGTIHTTQYKDLQLLDVLLSESNDSMIWNEMT